MSNKAKIPNWEIDELVLALDLYVRNRGQLPDADHPDVLKLSETLRRINPGDTKRFPNFRNPVGVYMKLQNFRSIDPRSRRKGGSGLSHGGKLDVEVWHQFADKPKSLKTYAEAIVIQRDVLR